MGRFNRKKLIGFLNREKAEVEKRYWFADTVGHMVNIVKGDDYSPSHILGEVSFSDIEYYPFKIHRPELGSHNSEKFALIYPYEGEIYDKLG